VYFGGPWSGNCLYILWPFGICYGHWENATAIWNILLLFSKFLHVLVRYTKTKLATLLPPTETAIRSFYRASINEVESTVKLLKHFKKQILRPTPLQQKVVPKFSFFHWLNKKVFYELLKQSVKCFLWKYFHSILKI
jgi:hypothetical protein